MTARLMGCGLLPAWVQIQVRKSDFQLDEASRHAMRLNSQTGTDGLPVSSINCDNAIMLRNKSA